MYPHERSLVKRFESRPFALIGVNSDRNREVARKAVRTKNLSWRSFWADGERGPIPLAWNVRKWPTLYVLDHTGVIRWKGHGTDGLDAVIEECVEATERDRR